MRNTLYILIVDDDQRMAKTLKDIFNIKGYEAEVTHSGHDALKMVVKDDFDLVLTDIKMPRMNGVELCRKMRESRPHIPILLMTAYSTDILVKEGLEEGAVIALHKPLDLESLLDLFSSLRKERSVVIADNDYEFCSTLGNILRTRDFAVTHVTDPQSVTESIKSDSHVVLLDMNLDVTSSLMVLERIRERYFHLPVILMTAHQDEIKESIDAAFKIGAYTCLYKPFHIKELFQFLTEIRHKEMKRVLKEAAMRR
ncbi:MAG: response regulator [Thermodesulfobacteriota bacterium]|nr:response regulator [Thermodesulfobacteriota bacterium]